MTATPTAPTPIPEHSGPDQSAPPRRTGRIGLVVTGSLTTGLLTALLLVLAPSTRLEPRAVTGAVLLGFALGWALLAVLSVRLTDQPQRWAAAPALFMGVGGLLLTMREPSVHEVLDWVWPPALLVLSLYMATRAHRDLRSRTRRLLVYPVIAVLVLCSLGGCYQMVRQAMDGDSAPGRLVDVGGHRLHLHCTGSGSPTVVIEPGAGMTGSDAALLASKVAGTTRVCVYDRAGRGWSEPADNRQDGAEVAADLHTLLDRADVPGPYVLAGHSFGGLYVLTYAERYPDEVAGVVLIDSTAPAEEPGAVAEDEGSYDAVGRFVTAVSGLVGTVIGPDVGSTMNEYAQGSRSTRQAAALTDLGDTPLVVLVAKVGSDAEWMANQRALAALSTNSTARVVLGATHAGLLLDERQSNGSMLGILDLVANVRDGTPLECELGRDSDGCLAPGQ